MKSYITIGYVKYEATCLATILRLFSIWLITVTDAETGERLYRDIQTSWAHRTASSIAVSYANEDTSAWRTYNHLRKPESPNTMRLLKNLW